MSANNNGRLTSGAIYSMLLGKNDPVGGVAASAGVAMPTAPTYAAGVSTLAFSLNYNLAKNLTVAFDATNLLTSVRAVPLQRGRAANDRCQRPAVLSESGVKVLIERRRHAKAAVAAFLTIQMVCLHYDQKSLWFVRHRTVDAGAAP
jgi:hypothetical protein